MPASKGSWLSLDNDYAVGFYLIRLIGAVATDGNLPLSNVLVDGRLGMCAARHNTNFTVSVDATEPSGPPVPTSAQDRVKNRFSSKIS